LSPKIAKNVLQTDLIQKEKKKQIKEKSRPLLLLENLFFFLGAKTPKF
jgi:hypothetical protein